MNSVKLLLLAGSVSVFAGCQSWQQTGIGDLPPTAALPEQSEPGKVQVWYYDGIGGLSVADLTSSAAYPDSPSEVTEITSLQRADGRGGQYGTLVRGFIEPPADGNYRFFVSGDDEVQFWLSDSSSADGKKLVASVTGWSYEGEYTKYSSQTSPYISLSGGQRYYFEILHKEEYGGDHFSVAWEGGGLSQQVVGGSYIHSWAGMADGQSAQEAYSLGYRVGFVDGTAKIAFNPSFPPLDADQDGLYDNWETINGLDPNNSADAATDPDGDFLAAADEFLIGTSENNADTDGDGIPDGSEFAYALDPLDSSDAALDSDNDGYSNLDEYQAGTELDNPESLPADAPTPPQFASGFVGQYYNGTSFDSYVLSGPTTGINYDWGTNAPDSSINRNYFTVRWTGSFTPPHSSGQRTYVFALRGDDGVRLRLGSNTIINGWKDQAATTYTGEVSLAAGTSYPLTVEYYEKTGQAVAQLTVTDSSTGNRVDLSQAVSSPDLNSESSLDSDNDGIPDYWELLYGTNVYENDSGVAYNSSGVVALEAYQSGLHPWTLESVSSDGGGSGTTSPTSVSLYWTAPTTRTDGSSLSSGEISHYEISYGTSSSDLDQSIRVDGNQTSYTLEGLASGTWYFGIRVVDTSGLSSQLSDPVSYSVN